MLCAQSLDGGFQVFPAARQIARNHRAIRHRDHGLESLPHVPPFSSKSPYTLFLLGSVCSNRNPEA
mgnify:CR=1 FL=1|jgi:hypothetical protein